MTVQSAPRSESAHRDHGLRRLLTLSPAYTLFSHLISRSSTRPWIRDHLIKAGDGSRILDLGCGPGDLVGQLPSTIAEYLGVDLNPAYVRTAQERWKHRSTVRFALGDAAATSVEPGHYDIVTAIGLLHHLDDAAAEWVMAVASNALVDGGRLVTYDGAYVDGQHPFAKWLISQDRGRAVRSEAGYRRLAEPHFGQVKSELLHDTLRVPYTICAMTCVKTGHAGGRRAAAGAEPPRPAV